MNNQAKRYFSVTVFFFMLVIAFLSGGMETFAQLPTHVPSPEAEPVGFFDSWGKFIFYVVLPVIIIILYFVWRRRNRKIRRRKEEERRMREKEKKQ